MEFLPAAADDFVSNLLSVKIAAAFWIFLKKPYLFPAFQLDSCLLKGCEDWNAQTSRTCVL
jgi:hypothetical protein